MARRVQIGFVVLLFAAGASAQVLGEVALQQALLDVGNPFRLMCVAAHPDDEDGATLAYYRMKYGVETHAVVATRGEGGQNETGPELYAALGVIRTREMMAAAAVEGASLHFLNLPEFGYSKTREETERLWGKDETLRRVVTMIRRVRPHVIITNHGRMLDHGHHQAIGAALIEAFDRAGDPDYATGALPPWRVSRLFIRAWAPGPDSLQNDISELEPVRGKTYAEIAAEALGKHESQGMQFFIDRYLTGQPKTHYDLVKGMPLPPDPWQGLFPGLFAGLPLPEGWTAEAVRRWRGLWPGRGEADFARRAATTPPPGGQDERAAFARLMAVIHGLRLEVEVDDWSVTPGQALKLRVQVRDYGQRDFEHFDFTVDSRIGGATQSAARVAVDATGVAVAEFDIPVMAGIRTVPHAAFLYTPLEVWRNLTIAASPSSSTAPPCRLRTTLHVDVAPPVMIALPEPRVLMSTEGKNTVTVSALLTNHLPRAQDDTVSIRLPEGWTAENTCLPVAFAREDEQRQVSFVLQRPDHVNPGSFDIGLRMDSGYETTATVAVVDLKVPRGKRVGIVQSYDDTFVKTLARMGVPYQLLSMGDFVPTDLDGFTTIIVDIRAYLNRPDLVANNQSLLDYVERGGTLIVMYQKTFEWQEDFAPYPLRVSRNRVTREDAPMEILDPMHPLFNRPNRIIAHDWDGWRQERGLYFPDHWSPAYTPLIACVEPGEDIPPGGLLVAPHGQGTYLYTALGWYRQLRELHPGALRVFANMLAL